MRRALFAAAPLDVSFGISFVDFPERRANLCTLVSALVTLFPHEEVLVASESSLPPCAGNAVHVPSKPGVAAKRNSLARSSKRTYLALLDDDVAIDAKFDVVRLLALVKAGADIAAACYTGVPDESWLFLYNNACGAANFSLTNTTLTLSGPTGRPAWSGVTRAHTVQNTMVLRTAFLREHSYDERLVTVEDVEWFWAARNATIVFDPAVVVMHNELNRSAEYSHQSTRYKEADSFPVYCRNHPRIHVWALPFFQLDCSQQTLTRRTPWGDQTQPLRLGNDVSTRPYTPPSVKLFFSVLMRREDQRQRDLVRSTWIQTFYKKDGLFDYSFVIGTRRKNDSRGIPAFATRSDAKLYGDIVALDVADNYRDLGEKSLAAIRWSAEHVDCDFLVKADGDTWVHPQGLWRDLSAMSIPGHFYGGSLFPENPVLREGIWSISVGDIVEAAPTHTVYVSGSCIVLHPKTAMAVVDAVVWNLEPYLPSVEDVMLGRAAAALGIVATSVDSVLDAKGDCWEWERRFECAPPIAVFHKPHSMELCNQLTLGIIRAPNASSAE